MACGKYACLFRCAVAMSLRFSPAHRRFVFQKVREQARSVCSMRACLSWPPRLINDKLGSVTSAPLGTSCSDASNALGRTEIESHELSALTWVIPLERLLQRNELGVVPLDHWFRRVTECCGARRDRGWGFFRFLPRGSEPYLGNLHLVRQLRRADKRERVWKGD